MRKGLKNWKIKSGDGVSWGDLLKKAGKGIKETAERMIENHKVRVREIERRKDILNPLPVSRLKQLAREYGIPTSKEYQETYYVNGWPRIRTKRRALEHHELINVLDRNLTPEQFEMATRKLPSYYPAGQETKVNLPTPPKTEENADNSGVAAELATLIEILTSYNPQKYAKKEETYEEALRQRIEGRLGLPDNTIIRQYKMGDGKVDLCWPEKRIAIEIKSDPHSNEINRLMGQIYTYTKNEFLLIVAIFNLRMPNLATKLTEYLQEGNYKAILIIDGKVFFKPYNL